MTGKEKKSIYEAVEGRYSDPTYANEASILTREVIKISEEWLAQSKITPKTTRREARKDLKIYVMSKINLNDYKKRGKRGGGNERRGWSSVGRMGSELLLRSPHVSSLSRQTCPKQPVETRR